MAEKCKICPSASDLEKDCQRNIPCPVIGCNAVLPHQSSLRFHVVKVHGIVRSEADRCIAHREKMNATTVSCQFCCPIAGCIYGTEGSKHFPSFKLLKQHFMKLHAPKRYPCAGCKSAFGLLRDLRRHEKACHQHPSCDTCGVWFPTQEVLNTHCEQMHHVHCLMETEQDNEASFSESYNGDSPERSTDRKRVTSNLHDDSSVSVPETCSDKETVSEPCTTMEATSRVNVEAIASNQTAVTSVTGSEKNSVLPLSKSSQKLPVQREMKTKRCGVLKAVPTTLLPKPGYVVMPIIIQSPLVLITSKQELSSFNNNNKLRKIAAKPQELTEKEVSLLVSNLSQPVSASSAMGSTTATVTNVATQTSHLPARCRRRKATSTQTITAVGIELVKFPKESRPLQVSSRVRVKRPRDVQNSHTQTHGTNRKLCRISAPNHLQDIGNTASVTDSHIQSAGCREDDISDSAWPDVASNATQTIDTLPGLVVETQTIESFLSSAPSDELLQMASGLLMTCDDIGGVHLSLPRVQHADAISVEVSDASGFPSGEFLMPDNASRAGCSYQSTLERQMCDAATSYDILIHDLVSDADAASSSSFSRLMLTSSSQTIPIVDAASTQTMDCDFGCGDIDDLDFIHTETQTTDLLANYFNFCDIETQTAAELELWDSETQTCFDALFD